jgi:hypothetical protein
MSCQISSKSSLRRLGHHDLAAGVLEHTAAEGFLFQGHEPDLSLQRGERGCESGRPGPYDHKVEVCTRAVSPRVDLFDGLSSLLHCIADQSHTAQLACDEESRDVGLEPGTDLGQVHAARGRPENQVDGTNRAGDLAGPVADAVGRADKLCLAVDQAQDVVVGLLGTRLDAGTTADALESVDRWMQRSGFDEARFQRFLVNLQACPMGLVTPPHVPDHQQANRYQVDQ